MQPKQSQVRDLIYNLNVCEKRNLNKSNVATFAMKTELEFLDINNVT